MVLHFTMLMRLCGIAKPLTTEQTQELAAEATKDFLEAFFD
jgi:hypothetical protein